jgi:repressor LexA
MKLRASGSMDDCRKAGQKERSMKAIPTLQQARVLAAIGKYSAEHGYGPSYANLADALHYRSVSTVAHHVKTLKRMGYVTWTIGARRSLRVVAQ